MSKRALYLLVAILSPPGVAGAQYIDKPMNGPLVNGTQIGVAGRLEGIYNVAGDPSSQAQLEDELIASWINPSSSTDHKGLAIVEFKNKLVAADVVIRVKRAFSAPWQYPSVDNFACGACLATASNGTPLQANFFDLLYQVGAAWNSKKDGSPLCPGGQPAIVAAWQSTYDSVAESFWKNSSSPKPVFTIACPGSALYHCAQEWGYSPFLFSLTNSFSPVFPLNACVHAIRADYCHDGKSTTLAGTPVIVQFGGKSGGSAPKNNPFTTKPEAIWSATTGAARCVNVESLRNEYYLATSELLSDRIAGHCGSSVNVYGPKHPDTNNDCAAPGPSEIATYPYQVPQGICLPDYNCQAVDELLLGPVWRTPNRVTTRCDSNQDPCSCFTNCSLQTCLPHSNNAAAACLRWCAQHNCPIE